MRRFLFGEQAPGEHTVVWDGRDGAGRQVGSGVYVYKLSAQVAGGWSKAGSWFWCGKTR
ncbi:MAG: FlgD immunoglobulin-like domain containing protein [bacterium]